MVVPEPQPVVVVRDEAVEPSANAEAIAAYENDVTSSIVKRNWTSVTNEPVSDSQHTFKLMHWNILAQRLCDGFDKISDNAPML